MTLYVAVSLTTVNVHRTLSMLALPTGWSSFQEHTAVNGIV